MSCKRFEHWAGLYIEGDLGDRASRRLERHAASCSRCRELVRGLEESQEVLRGWGGEDVPQDAFTELRRRIRSSIEVEVESGAELADSVSAGAWWRFALAGGVALLLMGWLFFSAVQAPQSEPEQMAREMPTPLERPAPEPKRPALESESGLGVNERVSPAEKAVVERPVVDAVRNEMESAKVATAEQPRAEPPADDLVVKLLTEDPNIVIYWLVSRNGG